MVTEQNAIFHFLLIDIEMPEIDGPQLTKMIRKYESENNVKNSYIIGMKTSDDE